MSTPLSGDKLNEERAFVKRYADGLSEHKITYSDDYSTPLEDRPRKVTIVQVPVADAPEVQDEEGPQDTSISITIKSLKPSLSIPLTVQLTDSVSTLKSLIAKSSPQLPVPSQRLLLKGKALVDSKLLKEYDLVDGATLNLMIKPVSTSPATPAAATGSALDDKTLQSPRTPSHHRTASDPAAFKANDLAKASSKTSAPTLTITASLPGEDGEEREGVPTPLTLRDTMAPLGPQPAVSSASFHSTISNPEFWSKIHNLCKENFVYEDDADAAWETFLVAMKSRLSAGEAAKIRDVVGINGMGGGAL